MKTKTKITIGFTAEIVFFVLVGVYLIQKELGYMVISIIAAMLTAGYVGKLIEKDAIDKFLIKQRETNKKNEN